MIQGFEKPHAGNSTPSPSLEHPPAWTFSLLLTGAVLGLMSWWFAVANRYVVFLYYHDMGPRVPDTRPFSPVTRSRYWMTGLVAGGGVMVLYVGINWLIGRMVRRYAPPAWWRVWAWSAPALALGIPAITMTINSPTLPPWLAAMTTLTTLLGLALALQPGHLAARRPLELTLLAIDGLSLALWLVTLPGLAYVPYWLEQGEPLWLAMLVAVPALGLVGLAAVTGLRCLLHRQLRSLGHLVLAGLCAAYLLLPLTHHLLGTGGRFYITDMDNFFSRNPWIQLGTWGVTFGLAWGAVRLRRRIQRRLD
ncbi:MAG: hypothetical protein ACP5JG_16725 [Anaerolineae bacterium]